MSVNNPPNPNVSTFNNLYWISSNTSISQGQADLRYLKYPTAQGTENLQTTNVNGVLTANSDLNVKNVVDIQDVTNPSTQHTSLTTLSNSFTANTIGTTPSVSMAVNGINYLNFASNTNQLTLVGTNIAFTSPNPPTSNATQPADTDSSNKIPTTAWVQSAIVSYFTTPITTAYTTSQTITPPPLTARFDITIMGSGGGAGDVGIFGSYLVFGGAGAAGNAASATNIAWTTGTITLVVQPKTNGGRTSVTFASSGTAYVYNGGNGSTGASGGGGAAGVASSTPNSLPAIATWTSYSGTNGTAGSSYSYPAGFPNPPNTIGGSITGTSYTAGTQGGGQSYTASNDSIAGWNASPYTAGGCIITWYKY